MPCYFPRPGKANPAQNGKWVSLDKAPHHWEDLTISCNQCLGCRLRRGLEWTTRNTAESYMHDEQCFITLTYDDENLPHNRSLNYTHFQKFIRSLRDDNKRKTIRYFGVGEYGDNFGRPHFHALLYGHEFKDAKKLKGTNLNTSEELSARWLNRGYVSIGEVNFETASYVSNYVQKKVLGKNKNEHYGVQWLNKTTGELHDIKYTNTVPTPDNQDYFWKRQPEKSFMSLKPGIGMPFYDKYKHDIFQYNKDGFHHEGKLLKPPKIWSGKYELQYPNEFQPIKEKREQHMEDNAHLFTPEALTADHANVKARMSLYKRNKLK
jgi:hypothetical protein